MADGLRRALLAGLTALLLAGGAFAAPFPGQREAAEAGDPRAQFALAIMYDTGDGVPHNWPLAVKWFTRAAEGGYAVAQAKLGLMYLFGWAVPRDPVEAAKWYALAAEQGYAPAQARLASLYQTGTGVPKDPAFAYFWASRAAARGNLRGVVIRDRLASEQPPGRAEEDAGR
jgi:TPR repeat protein